MRVVDVIVKRDTNFQRRVTSKIDENRALDYFLDQEIFGLTNMRTYNKSVRQIFSSVVDPLNRTLWELNDE